MKIAVVGDTHFGLKSNSLVVHENNRLFYEKCFFPHLKNSNIKTVIQTGDLVDRRQEIAYNSLYLADSYFLKHFEGDLKLFVYAGNHDVPFRNTLKVNALELLLKSYDNITTIIKPRTINFNGLNIDFIPWICEDNEQDIKQFINSSKSHICFGHFEIAGFEMDRGNVCKEGMNRSDLKRYEMVISGHFHHKSTDGHIFYVGTPNQQTWADVDDVRGFHIFDTETKKLEFVENPYSLFHKIEYVNGFEGNIEKYRNCFIKVVVKEKGKKAVFDKFIEELQAVEPANLSIEEIIIESENEEEICEGEDTITFMNRFVEAETVDLDKDRLKSMIRVIYNEANRMEV